MPIRRISRDEVPATRRAGYSAFAETIEFQQLEKMIRAGIRPEDTLEIELCQESLAAVKSKNPLVRFSVLFKKRVSRQKFHYDIFRCGKKLYVEGRNNAKVKL